MPSCSFSEIFGIFRFVKISLLVSPRTLGPGRRLWQRSVVVDHHHLSRLDRQVCEHSLVSGYLHHVDPHCARDDRGKEGLKDGLTDLGVQHVHDIARHHHASAINLDAQQESVRYQCKHIKRWISVSTYKMTAQQNRIRSSLTSTDSPLHSGMQVARLAVVQMRRNSWAATAPSEDGGAMLAAN